MYMAGPIIFAEGLDARQTIIIAASGTARIDIPSSRVGRWSVVCCRASPSQVRGVPDRLLPLYRAEFRPQGGKTGPEAAELPCRPDWQANFNTDKSGHAPLRLPFPQAVR